MGVINVERSYTLYYCSYTGLSIQGPMQCGHQALWVGPEGETPGVLVTESSVGVGIAHL